MTQLPNVKPFDDVPLRLNVVIGTAMMKIDALFRLREGSTVVSTRPVGDRLDLTVQDVVLAKVEVFGPSENAAVRVTEMLTDG